MRVHNIKIFFTSFILAILIICYHHIFASQSSQIDLTISAAASLQPVMDEIKTAYEKNYHDVVLKYNFGASGLLQQQIETGAPVDIFFAASPVEMDKLQEKKLLINNSRHNILQNNITLITAKNNQEITKISDLTSNKVSQIIIGDPNTVPAGRYAKQVLEYEQIWEQVSPKLVLAKDAQAVLTYVDLGYVDAGLVYQSSTNINDRVKIVAIAPSQSHQPINYPIAIIKDSSNIESAQKFINFLTTNQAKKIFRKYNFIYR